MCDIWLFVSVLICLGFLPPAPSAKFLQRTWFYSFVWLHSIAWCICTIFSLSSIDGHLGYLHAFAIVNSAAVIFLCIQSRLCDLSFPYFMGSAGWPLLWNPSVLFSDLSKRTNCLGGNFRSLSGSVWLLQNMLGFFYCLVGTYLGFSPVLPC